MSEWKTVKIGDFLQARLGKYKPSDNEITNLKRLDKIDFKGNIHLSDKPTKTDMIIINQGDLVISGINVAKGAIAVYQGQEPITATIHYSAYQFDNSLIDIEFLKRFLKSPAFINALKEQVKGGIKTEIKPKTLLSISVNLPELSEQQIINKRFDNFENELVELNSEISNQQTYLTKLRQAILQEAIEGKLTENWRIKNPVCLGDPNTDATALLKTIKAEKQKLITEGKIKKEKPLAPINPNDVPFALPDGWVWVRFGDYVIFERGRFSVRPRNDKSCYGGKYPFIQISSLSIDGDIIKNHKQTLNEKGYLASKEFPKGTIAIAIVGGTIGNLGVLGMNMCFPDSMVGIRPFEGINQKYNLCLLKYKQSEIKKAAYQMAGQPNIKIPTLAELIIPLPPLAEQQAIVERVDSLLNHINALEQQTTERKHHAEQLMQAVLKEAFTA